MPDLRKLPNRRLLAIYLGLDSCVIGERGSVLLDDHERFTDAFVQAARLAWRQGVELVLMSDRTCAELRVVASVLLGSSSYIGEGGYGIALGQGPLEFLVNAGSWRLLGALSVAEQIEQTGAIRLLFAAFPGLQYDRAGPFRRQYTVSLRGPNVDVGRANALLIESGVDLELVDKGPFPATPHVRRYQVVPRAVQSAVAVHMGQRKYLAEEVVAIGGSAEDFFHCSLDVGRFYLINGADDPQLAEAVMQHRFASITAGSHQAGVLEAVKDALGRSRRP